MSIISFIAHIKKKIPAESIFYTCARLKQQMRPLHFASRMDTKFRGKKKICRPSGACWFGHDARYDFAKEQKPIFRRREQKKDGIEGKKIVRRELAEMKYN